MEKFPLFMLAYDALQAVNGMVGLVAVCYHQETNSWAMEMGETSQVARVYGSVVLTEFTHA